MTVSTVLRFWQSRIHGGPALPSGLMLSEFFNPASVKVGQWFSRIWIDGQALESPMRLRVARVQPEKTGRLFIFVHDGLTMAVCAATLKKDFLRICDRNRQPFTGEELTEIKAPEIETKKPKYWYVQN